MSDYKNIVGIKFAKAEQPEFKELKAKGYVQFGKNNDYPDYLMGLYNESPKHGAIVKGKANYIYGNGFEGIPIKANTKGETFNQIAKKCIIDDEMYGGYYLQIIYNLLGKIKDVYHIEYHKVRSNKEQTEFKVKNDWADNREDARDYPAFTTDPAEIREHPIQILFVKQYNPKSDIYPMPSYFQGLNYIESDVQVSRHILGNAKDGFVATTLINLNNGEPQDEQKAAVESGLKKKFTGSEGDRMVIMFNPSRDNAAEILPLSQTMLTKEDFTNINNLIQQEIFASHQVTSPMLFGIKTEGQLGGRSEIVDAYEIFNNTYVNERQQAHEEVFNKLLEFSGYKGEYKITPVEPLGFSIKEDLLLEVMPREYFLDKLGVDQKYYALPPAKSGGAPQSAPFDVSGQMAVNSNLKGMSGREFQHMDRIVKKYKKGVLNRDQAAMMLKNSWGLSDEDIATMLDADSMDQQFSDQEEIDFAIVEQFAQFGEDINDYEILSSKPAREAEYFADVKQLSELESNIINLIKKDKRITAEVIAKTLKQDVAVVSRLISNLEKANIIAPQIVKVGEDNIVERTATDTPVQDYKPTTVDILLRYTYSGPKDERNRPFCAKMMELSKAKVWSRSDIERISERLGYSVWDRRGGWFTQPSGIPRPSCRHQWNALTVLRKSN